MVAGKPVKPRSVTFVPEPRNDLIAPDRGRLAQDEGETWVYAAVSFRLPGIRARALDQPGSMQRLAWNLIPDYSAGVAVRKGHFPVLASLSWPILVERLYFFWGASFVPQPRFFPGYGEGQLLPLTTNLNDVRRYVWEHEYVFGLSVDVIRSK